MKNILFINILHISEIVEIHEKGKKLEFINIITSTTYITIYIDKNFLEINEKLCWLFIAAYLYSKIVAPERIVATQVYDDNNELERNYDSQLRLSYGEGNVSEKLEKWKTLSLMSQEYNWSRIKSLRFTIIYDNHVIKEVSHKYNLNTYNFLKNIGVNWDKLTKLNNV